MRGIAHEPLARASILDSRVHTLRSTLVGEDYEIATWLPPTYAASSRRYPVLYLLDAPVNFGLAIPIVLGANWEHLVPELVVVGIGKRIRRLEEWWPIRARDYAPKPLPGDPRSGHGATFLQFIRSELFPFIDAKYRTEPADRTIWGHSLGGAFVLFTLFTAPGLFQRYIATSPDVFLDGAMLLDPAHRFLPATLPAPARLFISVGSEDEAFRRHIEAFFAALQSRTYPGLRVEMAVVEGYAHLLAGYPGFIQGLQAVFSDGG